MTRSKRQRVQEGDHGYVCFPVVSVCALIDDGSLRAYERIGWSGDVRQKAPLGSASAEEE